MKMHKILFLLPSRALSGGVLVARHHAMLLAAKGYEVTVAYLHTSDLDNGSVLPIIEPAQEILYSELDRDITFDAVVATWWETAYHAAQIKARRYFYFVQGFEERLYPTDSVWPLLVQRTYQSGFNFITVNSGLQKYLQNQFGQSSIVIPPGINLDDYDCEPKIARGSESLRVLVEGAPDADYKRVALAFEALSQISSVETIYVSPKGKARPEWKVDYFFESVPPAEMPSICKSCDLVLKLSTDESFSLPVLESFAAGATAITADYYGGSDFIVDGKNALVVAVDDLSAAVAALRRLQSDRKLLSELKAQAKATAAIYSWNKMAEKMESALLAGFDFEAPETPPLAGCLAQYQALHAMRLELTQAQFEKEHYKSAHSKVSAELHGSRAYRVGNSLVKAFRSIARNEVER
jgi:glycosyltransferase involved in cell wall biosynthesis